MTTEVMAHKTRGPQLDLSSSDVSDAIVHEVITRKTTTEKRDEGGASVWSQHWTRAVFSRFPSSRVHCSSSYSSVLWPSSNPGDTNRSKATRADLTSHTTSSWSISRSLAAREKPSIQLLLLFRSLDARMTDLSMLAACLPSSLLQSALQLWQRCAVLMG